MKLLETKEQTDCIHLASNNEITKIEAIAGSGKTSTLVMISQELLQPSLYMAFNKKMAEEASQKFNKHVDCRTVHSIAYRSFGHSYMHKLKRPVGRYVNVAGTASEIAKYFQIPIIEINEDTVITPAFIGLIIKDSVAKYEQSADESFDVNKHLPIFHKKEVQTRFGDYGLQEVMKLVAKFGKKLWTNRISVISPVLCTHDTYLKLYQLSKPDLSEMYKIIYADEQQDVNDCMLDLILNQKGKCKLIVVGDSRQQIYAWRGAVNAMNKIQAKTGNLSKSFRYGESIAAIARAVLQNKVKISGNENVESVVGIQEAVNFDKPYTILFRKNTTLVFRAIELISEGESVSINIDVKDFVEMLSSAHALFQGDMRRVKHENILPYSNWYDFTNEAKSAPDLNKLVKIILSGDADYVIDTLHRYKKDKNAKVTLTTSHKAKGLEYDQVVLADDFPSVYNTKGEYVGLTEEEENLLYVACTRAKHALNVNPTVLEILKVQGKKDESDYLVDYKTVKKVKLPTAIDLRKDLGHFNGEDYVFD